MKTAVVVLAIVASALGVPAPEADPQLIVPGATTTLGALPLAGARTIVNAPAVAVQTPVVATPAVRTINTIPAPVAAPIAVPTLLGKSAPCVNDANIPVPCADGAVLRAAPVAPIAAPIAPIAAPIPRTVVTPLAAPRPLVAHPNGAVVPLDEPAVAAARADHLAAKGVLPIAPVAPIARTVVNPVVAPIAAPVARTVISAPIAAPLTTPLVRSIAPARVFTPRDCVTPGGCAVRAAIEGRTLIVKRDAEATSEADAEADPQFLATTGLPLAYNNLALNNLAYNTLGYNNLYSNTLYNGLYNGVYNPYNYAFNAYAGPLAAPRPLVAHPNGAVVPLDEPAVAAARADHLAAKGVLPVAPVAAPIVRAALPAPVAVNTALPVAAPAVRTVAQTVVAAPAPIATPLVRAVRPAVVQEAVPVTYTHLGAHPIQPTTVIEGKLRTVPVLA